MNMEAYVTQYPLISIILISAVISLISTLLLRHFTDQDHLKSLKKRQKELQKEIKEAQKKKEFTKLEELNKEIVDLSLAMMKSSFSIKMMLITFLPVIFLFHWLRGIYNGAEPLLAGWFWWYLGTAVVSSSIYRKLFKMA